MPKLGDIVVTSGTAQIFPVDILAGKINKIEKNDFMCYHLLILKILITSKL